MLYRKPLSLLTLHSFFIDENGQMNNGDTEHGENDEQIMINNNRDAKVMS